MAMVDRVARDGVAGTPDCRPSAGARWWMSLLPGRGLEGAGTRVRSARARVVGILWLAAIIWGLYAIPERHLEHSEVVAIRIMGAIASAAYVVWALTHEAGRPDELLVPRPALIAAQVMGLSGACLTGLTGNGVASVFPAIATATFGVFLPPIKAFPVTLTYIGVMLGTNLLVGHGTETSGYAGMLLGVYAISSARRSYIQRATQAERLVAETERANAEQAHAATLAERARVAREIHDVLAHSLAALTVQLEVADALLADGRDLPRAQGYVTRAQRIAREGLAETRRAIAALRDDSAPLSDLLGTLVDAYRTETDATATLTVTGRHRPLGHDAALTLYRTAQEAFTNVRKHAPGAPITMALDYDSTTLLDAADVPAVELRIANRATTEATGDLHASGGGYGLTGMRERAELLRGDLVAEPVADGWQVVVRIPHDEDLSESGPS